MGLATQERITARVNHETKELLERAAALSGYPSLNSFIANVAVAEAKRLVEQERVLNLCQDDALAFVQALEAPFKPNRRFLRAARRHKETVNNEDSTTR